MEILLKRDYRFTGGIQQNQKSAKALIEELMQLKNAIGEDVRTFGSHKETLQSILKTKVPMWRLTKSV